MFANLFGDDLSVTLAIIGAFAIPIALIWAVCAIVRANNRRRVDMVLAEQGIKPEVAAPVAKQGTVLVWACSLLGLGIGIALSALVSDTTLGTAFMVIFLGAGMLGGYFLRHTVEKEK